MSADCPTISCGNHNRDQRQIFIADDSFGRTEYNPERVSHWQDDLPSILRKINKAFVNNDQSKTSFGNGKREIRYSWGKSGFSFACRSSCRCIPFDSHLEKTLMLYKHMKQSSLTIFQKVFVRGLAKHIVKHDGFTPERIRELASKTKETYVPLPLIEETLQNPTGRMSKTYRELPDAHKWFMISVLLNSPDHIQP